MNRNMFSLFSVTDLSEYEFSEVKAHLIAYVAELGTFLCL